MSHRLILTVLLLTLCQTGCRTKPAVGAWPGDDAVRRMLAEQGDAVTSIAAAVDATLERADGQAVRLDGAVAAARPDHLRLQLWKLSRPVLDLTLTPQGVWVWSANEQGGAPLATPATWSPGGAVWLPLPGHDFWLASDGRWLTPHVFVRTLGDGVTARATVDAATLTVTRVAFAWPGGEATVAFDRYRTIDAARVPTHITLTGQDGRIDLRLRDVEINAPLDPRVFTPPAKAARFVEER